MAQAVSGSTGDDVVFLSGGSLLKGYERAVGFFSPRGIQVKERMLLRPLRLCGLCPKCKNTSVLKTNTEEMLAKKKEQYPGSFNC